MRRVVRYEQKGGEIRDKRKDGREVYYGKSRVMKGGRKEEKKCEEEGEGERREGGEGGGVGWRGGEGRGVGFRARERIHFNV